MESPRVRRSAVPLPPKSVVNPQLPGSPPAARPVRVWRLRIAIVLTGLILASAAGYYVYLRFTQTANFYGDSYTTGHGPPDHHRFSTILCGMMGWRESNHARAGTMAEDPPQSDVIAANASHITDQSISIWLAGFNDVLFEGSQIRLHDFLTCVESNAALLAIPVSNRIWCDDSGITYQGDWTANPTLGGVRLGRRGAFATFQLSGITVLVGSALVVHDPAKVRVLVDGVERAMVSNTMEEPTEWGTRIQPALVKITGFKPGVHDIRVEAVGEGLTPFCWAAGLSGERLRPRVYVGGVVAIGPSGYALGKGGSVDASDLFSAGLERSMEGLASLGLNIRYSRPTLDIATQIADDRIHPNDGGNLSIARQIAAVMSKP